MGQYQKYLHQQVTNAKPFRFRESMSVYPNQTWKFPLNEIAIEVPKCTKYENL